MRYDVTALRKSIAVLEVLSHSETALGVSALAREAGIAKNMAFRICQTLCELGWLHLEPGPSYRLSLVPFHIFARPLERTQLTTAGHGPLQALAAETGETAYISVPDGQRAVHVQVIEGRGPLRVAGAIGHAFPLHATAQGKIFLAWRPELAAAILAEPLTAHTGRTLSDPRKLERELARIRRQGYALNREEYARGLIGCACPIHDRTGAVVAAIGLFAPASTLTPQAIRAWAVGAVSDAATTIARALGAMPERAGGTPQHAPGAPIPRR